MLQRDVRVAEPFTQRLAGHRSEVCGLRVRRLPPFKPRIPNNFPNTLAAAAAEGMAGGRHGGGAYLI